MAEHNTLTDPAIHEPKGASTAALGEVYVSNGAGGGTWTPLAVGTTIGFADFNDAATAGTPIVITGGAGYVYLTNDTLGAFTNTAYLPTGVTTAVWDTALNKFDWAAGGLELGDMIDIRLDITVTTTGDNQSLDVALEMDTDGFAFDIPFDRGLVKTAGTLTVDRYNGIYMGNTGALTGKARFKIQSDGNATVVVNGWYCKFLINR